VTSSGINSQTQGSMGWSLFRKTTDVAEHCHAPYSFRILPTFSLYVFPDQSSPTDLQIQSSSNRLSPNFDEGHGRNPKELSAIGVSQSSPL